MEFYIIIGLLVVLIFTVWFKNPAKMNNILLDSVVDALNEKKHDIASGILNKLPKATREQVGDELIIVVTIRVIDLVVDVIEEVYKAK